MLCARAVDATGHQVRTRGTLHQQGVLQQGKGGAANECSCGFVARGSQEENIGGHVVLGQHARSHTSQQHLVGGYQGRGGRKTLPSFPPSQPYLVLSKLGIPCALETYV